MFDTVVIMSVITLTRGTQ